MFILSEELVAKIEGNPQLFDSVSFRLDDGSTNRPLSLFYGTDWHFGESDKNPSSEQNPQRNILEGFFRAVGIKIDGFISTGDHHDLVSIYKSAGDTNNVGTLIANSYKKLAMLFGTVFRMYNLTSSQVLFAPGNHDTIRDDYGGGSEPEIGNKLYFEHFAQEFIHFDSPNSSSTDPSCCIFADEHSVVVIIGLNSTSLDSWATPGYGYIRWDHLIRTGRFIEKVKGYYRDKVITLIACLHHHLAPVLPQEDTKKFDLSALKKEYEKEYEESGKPALSKLIQIMSKAFPIASLTINARQVVQHLSGMGFSLVLHGHKHKGLNYRICYLFPNNPLEMCCYSGSKYFDDADNKRTLSLIEIDSYHGKITIRNVEYNGDTSKVEVAGIADTAVIPLISANPEVTVAEKKLHIKAKSLARDLPEESIYPNLLDTDWQNRRIVRTCLPYDPSRGIGGKGFFPSPPTQEYRRAYQLLLFLKKDEKNPDKVEILLNYHSPINEEPEFSYWDTFLMPTVRPGQYGDFLRGLKWDFLRRMRLWREDSYTIRKLGEAVDYINETIDKWSRTGGYTPKYIAENRFERLSPTKGDINLMEYELVQLLGLNIADFSRIFDLIPRQEQFDRQWETLGKHQKKGLAWLELDKWQKYPKAKQRNEDVIEWVKQVTEEDRKAAYQRLVFVGKYDKTPQLVRKIENVVHFKKKELIRRLRMIGLKGYDNYKIYANAKIRLKTIKCRTFRDLVAKKIYPAQTYVTRIGLLRVASLKRRLSEYNPPVDLFNLNGFCRITFEGGDELDILPPILEVSRERYMGEILLINDGIHRIYASAEGRDVDKIQVVMVSNVPELYPYYAFPTTWESVRIEESKPSEQYTKRHRQEENYRDYYRDFATVVDGKKVFEIGLQGGN